MLRASISSKRINYYIVSFNTKTNGVRKNDRNIVYNIENSAKPNFDCFRFEFIMIILPQIPS